MIPLLTPLNGVKNRALSANSPTKMSQMFQNFLPNSATIRVKTLILSIFISIREIWLPIRETERFVLYRRVVDTPGELAYMAL